MPTRVRVVALASVVIASLPVRVGMVMAMPALMLMPVGNGDSMAAASGMHLGCSCRRAGGAEQQPERGRAGSDHHKCASDQRTTSATILRSRPVGLVAEM